MLLTKKKQNKKICFHCRLKSFEGLNNSPVLLVPEIFTCKLLVLD